MPIIDSTRRILTDDPKPRQRCHWRQCPRDSTTGMKVCARCKLVRYCSKACQQGDWKKHKQVCREPQFLDIGGWIATHEPVLKWAAAQALGGYGGRNLTSTHGMVFRLFRTDRLPAEKASGPFVMFDATPVPLETMSRFLTGPGVEQLYTQSDVDKSAQIRREGGVGVAVTAFEIQGMPNDGGDFWFRRFKLGRPANGRQGFVPDWKRIVKHLTRDASSDPNIMRLIENALIPVPSTVEEPEEIPPGVHMPRTLEA